MLVIFTNCAFNSHKITKIASPCLFLFTFYDFSKKPGVLFFLKKSTPDRRLSWRLALFFSRFTILALFRNFRKCCRNRRKRDLSSFFFMFYDFLQRSQGDLFSFHPFTIFAGACKPGHKCWNGVLPKMGSSLFYYQTKGWRRRQSALFKQRKPVQRRSGAFSNLNVGLLGINEQTQVGQTRWHEKQVLQTNL